MSRSPSTTPMPGAFQVIHNNLDAAMEAAGITGAVGHAEQAGQVRGALGV